MYSFICDADDDLRFKEIYKPVVLVTVLHKIVKFYPQNKIINLY